MLLSKSKPCLMSIQRIEQTLRSLGEALILEILLIDLNAHP